MFRQYQYDGFLSHAVEDKGHFVNDLHQALLKRGLKIWYSSEELIVGTEVIGKITEGVRRSQFAVIIVSPTYLTKIWTLTEANAFLQRPGNSPQAILPVLMNVTAEQMPPQLSKLADVFAVRAEKGVESVANELFRVIRERQRKLLKRRVSQVVSGGVITGFLFSLYFFWMMSSTVPVDKVVLAVRQRLDPLHVATEDNMRRSGILDSANTVTLKQAATIYDVYKSTDSRYRNEYVLDTGFEKIRSKKNVESALKIDLDKLSPANGFGLDSVRVFLKQGVDESGRKVVRMVYWNLRPVSFESRLDENAPDKHAVNISHRQFMRAIDLKLTFPINKGDVRTYQADLAAVLPTEIYSFVKADGEWRVAGIRKEMPR